ncbi:MAG: exodeoxyribonuclease VII large subunit [Saprospirales bacterium]|nr:exodeoxyribonuclease VII large subunit [Saprospirales bacterium]
MATYTLFELQEYIRRVLALNFPAGLWITAEIAQTNRARGHVFLDLVQKGPDPESSAVAQASAVLWQRDYQRLKLQMGAVLEEILRDGRELRLHVRVDFNERFGLKLLITDIDPAYTLGRMELQRRQTIDTLRRAGLLERNKALPLPAVLQRIAVVSSEGAAGFQDFREHLAKNAFGFAYHCRLFSTAVQGKNLASEMIAALEQVAAQAGRFDCVAVLRGGGARLDLAGFDQLDLCKAAAALPLPLLTGIGHDMDETILDLVAYAALKTPTAVADFLMQRNLFFERQLLQLAADCREAAGQQMKIKALGLAQIETSVRWSGPGRVRFARGALDALAAQLPGLVRRRLQGAAAQLEQADMFCTALHPDTVLRRGFSLTLKDGKALAGAVAVAPGDLLETRLRDGSVFSMVT